MITSAPTFMRSGRTSATIGVAALLVAAGLGWIFPAALAPAWRCAVLVWIGPAVGSLVFVLIHQLTGGEWGLSLRPYLLSGTRLLPWMWLLLSPLVVKMLLAPTDGPWWSYAAPAAFALRSVLYGLVFWFLCSSAERAWPREGVAKRLGWVGPTGLIVVLFMTHLLVGDWLANLDAHWVSTAFPIVWLIGQAVAGLAVAVMVAVLAGSDPARVLGSRRRLGIDWGTLLFATAMLWCYVAFAQFLIVWSGNLPVEAAWFTRRLGAGWRFVPLALVVLHFLAPLLVLLSRRAKQNGRALVSVAVILLVAQLLHTTWTILPAFPDAPAAMPWLALVLMVALGALFTNRYLALVEREKAMT
jgi:hypothetical protein